MDADGPSSPRSPDRATRRALARRRDGDTCVWCGRGFGPLVPPTTDHLVPRAKGGPSWLENEVMACRRCNGARGHLGPAAWFEECLGRGLAPDLDRLLGTLTALEAAIERRGGQRRARPYLDHELRRLRRRAA